MDSERLADLDENFSILPVEPGSLPQWEALALETNPALHAADADFASSKADVRTAKAAFLPTMDVSASYNYNAESANPFSFFNNTASERAVISLNLTVPLYSGGGQPGADQRGLLQSGSGRTVAGANPP